MPTHDIDASSTINSTELGASSVACPHPPALPSETYGGQQLIFDAVTLRSTNEHVTMITPVSNNTAVGMSMMQEDSVYASTESGPADLELGNDTRVDTTATIMSDEVVEDGASVKSTSQLDGHHTRLSADDYNAPDTPVSMDGIPDSQHVEQMSTSNGQEAHPSDATNVQLRTPSPEVTALENMISPEPRTLRKGFYGTAGYLDVPPVDRELNRSSEAKAWEFSQRREPSQFPSSLFQTCSKYKGTQQSDRQIYNVEVTVLTVDVQQATMSGYLQICGLTPDHQILTTFFTGEIIGGPDQKYSFRTSDPAWGASDKTDVTHWARFPAWRSLSSHAKKDINFVYPLDQAPWWQQENIFMRWKEHFLVPDYKLKSIQGASFEGFYYICLNQIEGRISGIYFHSKSEKYQQLELKHDGKQGVWGKGVCPSVEFR